MKCLSSPFFKKHFFFKKIDKLITSNKLLAGNNAEFSAWKSQCVDSTFLLNRNKFYPAVDPLFPENAVLFPVDTIDEDTAEEKIPTLDTPILVYCKSGRRSFMAAMKLESYGYTHIYDIGSLVDWPYGLEY